MDFDILLLTLTMLLIGVIIGIISAESNKKLEWIDFNNKLPTNEGGEQVKILFTHSGWATPVMGMYTHTRCAS